MSVQRPGSAVTGRLPGLAGERLRCVQLNQPAAGRPLLLAVPGGLTP